MFLPLPELHSLQEATEKTQHAIHRLCKLAFVVGTEIWKAEQWLLGGGEGGGLEQTWGVMTCAQYLQHGGGQKSSYTLHMCV